MATDKLCESCRFYRPNPLTSMNADGGECRRFPPNVGQRTEDELMTDSAAWGEWPQVWNCDWCGEYEAAADSP